MQREPSSGPLPLVIFFLAACTVSAAVAQEVIVPAPGTEAWRPLTLPKVERMTEYTAVEVDGGVAVRAESDCAASALMFSLADVDLRRTPRLQWRWKIERGLSIPDERVKGGDDFAARVYVMFRFDPSRASIWERARRVVASKLYGDEIPGSAINYVWTSDEPPGAMWANPFASDSKMVSLGKGPMTDWTTETVDLRADYVTLFGHEPPPLLALALMTDADNSCQRATAYFADFRFLDASRTPTE